MICVAPDLKEIGVSAIDTSVRRCFAVMLASVADVALLASYNAYATVVVTAKIATMPSIPMNSINGRTTSPQNAPICARYLVVILSARKGDDFY